MPKIAMAVRPIAINAIDVSPDRPRTSLADIEELAASILEHGLLQPIVVEPLQIGRWVLVAGARRLAACRHLFHSSGQTPRWAAIPAVERTEPNVDRFVLAMVENVARRQLSEGETLTGLQLLRDLKHWGPSELARHLGVTRQWIQQYFRVAADPLLAQHVRDGNLSVAKSQDIRLARTAETREAALNAALAGASQRRIRHIVREHTEAKPQRVVQSHFAGGAQRGKLFEWPASRRGPTIETVSPAQGGRDYAALAQDLGLRVHLRDFGLAKLVIDAATQKTDLVELADLIRVLRADLTTAEARIQAIAP